MPLNILHQHAHLFIESVMSAAMNTSGQHPWEHLQSVMYTGTGIGRDIIVHKGTDNVTH